MGSGEVGGFFTDGGTFAAAACSPQLLEGSGFVTELERTLRIPAGRPALEVKFRAPEFDNDAIGQIRDAFEIQPPADSASLLAGYASRTGGSEVTRAASACGTGQRARWPSAAGRRSVGLAADCPAVRHA